MRIKQNILYVQQWHELILCSDSYFYCNQTHHNSVGKEILFGQKQLKVEAGEQKGARVGQGTVCSALLFFEIFIVIQLQLYAFSPHPSTPPQPNPPPSPTSVDFQCLVL